MLSRIRSDVTDADAAHAEKSAFQFETSEGAFYIKEPAGRLHVTRARVRARDQARNVYNKNPESYTAGYMETKTTPFRSCALLIGLVP